MIFNDGKTFSAYTRSILHSGYITRGIDTQQCSDLAKGPA